MYSFYIGLKICDTYFVHINDNGYERKEQVKENNIDGFVQCFKIFELRRSLIEVR